jgi:hypothetical protein
MKIRIPVTLAILAGLAPLAVGGQQAPVKLKVTSEIANVRLKPSIGSVIIRQIPEGNILESIGREGEWYLVKLEADDRGNTSGYVHESLVLPMDETVRPPRKPQIIELETKKPAEQAKTEPPVAAHEGAAEPYEAAGWSVSMTAGGQYTLGGELNKASQAFADFFATRSGVPGDVETGALHLSFVFGGELAFDMLPGVALVIGADFYSASGTSQVNYSRTKATDIYTAKPRFQAIPIRLGIALSPVREVSIKAGVSYTIARCGYSFSYAQDTFSQTMTGEADGAGIGAWGAIDLELPISENLGFLVEASGHYAPIKSFEGTGTYSDSSTAAPAGENGKLWAYDFVQAGKTISPLILIRSQRPAEAYVENARAAAIDFSGMSLKAGIKVRF